MSEKLELEFESPDPKLFFWTEFSIVLIQMWLKNVLWDDKLSFFLNIQDSDSYLPKRS